MPEPPAPRFVLTYGEVTALGLVWALDATFESDVLEGQPARYRVVALLRGGAARVERVAWLDEPP